MSNRSSSPVRRYEDHHLDDLAKVKSLRTLVMDSTSITPQGVAAFNRVRPEVRVRLSQRTAINRLGGLAHEGPEIATEPAKCDVSAELRKVLGEGHFVDAVEVDFSRLPDTETGPWEPFLSEEMLPLRTLTTLRKLEIGYCRLDDAGMYYLRSLDRLEHLSLPLAGVSSDGVKQVRGLKQLKSFSGGLSDESIRHVARLRKLESLGVSGSQLSDRGLTRLAKLRNLKALYLGATSVTGEGLQHLAENKSLEILHLTGSAANQLKYVANWKQLKQLDLSGTRVTDETISPLRLCEKLESLTLSDTPITDAGLAELDTLKNLKSLKMERGKISGEAFNRLGSLQELSSLYLYESNLTDEGLAHLKQFPKLRWLNLYGTKVTGRGLELLREFPALESLVIYNIALTAEDEPRLAALTNVKTLLFNIPESVGSTEERNAIHRRIYEARRKAGVD